MIYLDMAFYTLISIKIYISMKDENNMDFLPLFLMTIVKMLLLTSQTIEQILKSSV